MSNFIDSVSLGILGDFLLDGVMYMLICAALFLILNYVMKKRGKERLTKRDYMLALAIALVITFFPLLNINGQKAQMDMARVFEMEASDSVNVTFKSGKTAVYLRDDLGALYDFAKPKSPKDLPEYRGEPVAKVEFVRNSKVICAADIFEVTAAARDMEQTVYLHKADGRSYIALGHEKLNSSMSYSLSDRLVQQILKDTGK